MNRKKIQKITFIILGAIGLTLVGIYTFTRYSSNKKYVPSDNQYENRVAYIDSENSLLSEGFETCDEYIFDYYNPERATYSSGKNGLRKFILNNYKNNGYSDSGYLNIRFVINCRGQAGRYIIHENDLNLEPQQFNKNLKQQLFDLTVQLKEWNPNKINFKKDDKIVAVDSYMYISYRIENGEIIEILP